MVRRQLRARCRPRVPFQRSKAAFAELVGTYQLHVFYLCYRLLGDATEAEDATQETFLRAYVHRRRYDPARSLTTWLLSIAAHYCTDRLRRRHLRYVGLDDERFVDHPGLRTATIGPEAAALHAERHGLVHEQVWRLNRRDREVIILRYWGNLSHVEIAALTGSTASAVKSRLHAARLRLGSLFCPQPAALLTAEGVDQLIASAPVEAGR